MNNLDYWQAFVGDQSPEEFMRAFGAMDPELSVSRFLEERGHLYGVVNQGSWVDTFQAPEQHHRHTVRTYLLSYLDETREEWGPALEAKPPSIPRRYREKFDQDKYPPPPAAEDGGEDTPDPVVAEEITPSDSDSPVTESAAEDAAPETASDESNQASSEDAAPETASEESSEASLEEAMPEASSDESSEASADEAAPETASDESSEASAEDVPSAPGEAAANDAEPTEPDTPAASSDDVHTDGDAKAE